MLVTGVQPASAKGVSSVQGAVVEVRDATRTAATGSEAAANVRGSRKPGDAQPVVFPRQGLPVDPRPVELRREAAAARYRSDGGDGEHDHDHDDAA